MTVADDYNLRSELVTMNDVADFVDLFNARTSFVPTFSGSGSMTVSSASGGNCAYWQLGNLVVAHYYVTDLVTSGTASNEIRATLPIAASGASYGGGACVGNSSSDSGFYLFVSSTVVGFRKAGGGNYSLTTGNDIIQTVVYAVT